MKAESAIPRIQLNDHYSISRIIKGGWHLAGGHGIIEEQTAIEDMYAFVKAGVTTFDCADIYTGVETLIGKFLKKYQSAFQNGELGKVQIHTKYVPDYNALGSLKKEDTTAIIDRSLKRLGVEQLDLVQFAWWNYEIPGYVEAAMHLAELQKAGKIRFLGVTNFDGTHLQEILDAGVPILTNQVQYSVLDQRVEDDLNPIGKQQGIYYLCYGVIAGGFLSNRYLGLPDPEGPMENRSLTKYRLIIDEFGGYELFQELLQVLQTVARQYEVGIAEVATKYILDQPLVAGAIIGARNQKHLAKLQRINAFQLSPDDNQKIQALIAQSQGPLGPFYALERDKTGKHGRIMKYNLNERD